MMKPRTKLVAIHPVHGYPIPPPPDGKVSRRNARERNRVKSVNNGFDVLKRHIPSASSIKKLSKVSILSHAVQYIQNLQYMLNETGDDGSKGLEENAPMKWEAGTESPSPVQLNHSPATYPPPLTPLSTALTPLSTNTMYYDHYPRSYESGYETSVYSETESHVQGLLQSTFPTHHHQLYPNCALPSPCSTLPETYSLPKKVQISRETNAAGDSSGEEDDILDAIAEWQQTER